MNTDTPQTRITLTIATAVILVVSVLSMIAILFWAPPDGRAEWLATNGILSSIILASMRELWRRDASSSGEAAKPIARRARETTRPPLELVLLLVLACASPVLVTGCATGAAGTTGALITAAPKIRDVGCNGARVMCRWMDTACRATGGPHVLPDAPAVTPSPTSAPSDDNAGDAPAASPGPDTDASGDASDAPTQLEKPGTLARHDRLLSTVQPSSGADGGRGERVTRRLTRPPSGVRCAMRVLTATGPATSLPTS